MGPLALVTLRSYLSGSIAAVKEDKAPISSPKLSLVLNLVDNRPFKKLEVWLKW
jgi:hypothetical protein